MNKFGGTNEELVFNIKYDGVLATEILNFSSSF